MKGSHQEKRKYNTLHLSIIFLRILSLSLFTGLYYGASLVAQMVKNLPAIQETQFQSLGQEDPLEEEMATHSSILAWRIPWTEETGGLQFMRVTKSWTRLNDSHLHIYPLLLDHPHTTPTSHPSRPSQSTQLSSLSCATVSH